MDLKLLSEKVSEILLKHGFRLASLNFTVEEGEKILRVVVDKYAHNISLDEIVTLSEAIDVLLDEDFESEEKFILDVTTTGAEKAIPLEELRDYLGLYVHLTLVDGIKGPPTYLGKLQNINEDEVMLLIKDKSRTKEVVLKRNDLKKARRAIQI